MAPHLEADWEKVSSLAVRTRPLGIFACLNIHRAERLWKLREGRLVQPFGPEMPGKPFHLVYPESRRDDPTVLAVREWVMKVPGGLCELTG